ncbi:ABC transporter permease [Paraburkholderia caledonica]|nr:ABC transporter permease [Burkholderia sp. Bk]
MPLVLPRDFFPALRRWRLWSLLAWLDIRQRYARSALGPFWITLSMGVMVGSLGVVYGTLFGQPMTGYLPLVGTGFVVWGLIAGVLNDSCGAYINNANYIRQSDASLWTYIFQVLCRQLIMFAHNFVIVVVLIAVFGVDPARALIWFLPGLALLMLNLTWMAQIFALSSARYRDVPQLVAAVVQILFYITPLMWRPGMLSKHTWLITFNPFAALVDLVRSPLLGQTPAANSWMVCVCCAIVGWLAALWMYARAADRVAYWV